MYSMTEKITRTTGKKEWAAYGKKNGYSCLPYPFSGSFSSDQYQINIRSIFLHIHPSDPSFRSILPIHPSGPCSGPCYGSAFTGSLPLHHQRYCLPRGSLWSLPSSLRSYMPLPRSGIPLPFPSAGGGRGSSLPWHIRGSQYS